MEVHYCFDVKNFCANAVNDSEREAVKIELAIVCSEFPPALRLGDNSAQCAFKFVHKIPT